MNWRTLKFLEEHGFTERPREERCWRQSYPDYELKDPVYGSIVFGMEWKDTIPAFFYGAVQVVENRFTAYSLCFQARDSLEQAYDRCLDGIGMYLRRELEVRPMEELLLKRLGYVSKGRRNGVSDWNRDGGHIRFGGGWWYREDSGLRFVSLRELALAYNLKEMLNSWGRILKEDARDVYERRRLATA